MGTLESPGKTNVIFNITPLNQKIYFIRKLMQMTIVKCIHIH